MDKYVAISDDVYFCNLSYGKTPEEAFNNYVSSGNAQSYAKHELIPPGKYVQVDVYTWADKGIEIELDEHVDSFTYTVKEYNQ